MNGWFARTLLLVLSGLATLTLIGAIAAMPTPTTGEAPPPAPRVEIAPTPAAPQAAEAGGEVTFVARPAPATPSLPPERWLESIAYALIALATFAGAALLVLLRIAGHLDTIARSQRH